MKRLALLFLLVALPARAQDGIRVQLAERPALSADGSKLAFEWRGDIWVVGSQGGAARRMTAHPTEDHEPCWSPDGKELAFTSDRGFGRQVYVMNAEGGEPLPLTAHSAGFSLLDWSPDGTWFLTRAFSDTNWPDARRFFRVPRAGGQPTMLFDATAAEGRIGPDGKSIVFVREGTTWWRRGYRGPQSGQIWVWDGAFRKVTAGEMESRWPMWREDGKAVFYAGAEAGGVMNITEFVMEGRGVGRSRALTSFPDDAAVFPCMSRDGSTIVFRKLFDLYRLDVARGGEPTLLAITASLDDLRPGTDHRVLDRATDATFSADGLEIAFISGGDLWVMDTVLREPVRVTNGPEEERDPVFTNDGGAILFVSDVGGQPDIWRAERADSKRWWWRNERFNLRKLTDDADLERRLSLAPDGVRMAYTRSRGDVCTMTTDGKDGKCMFESWSAPEYCWSPDGRWLAVALEDADFNSDIWVRRADGTGAPVNVSRHPDNESDPAWSPDGRILAFKGRRHEGEEDIFYVWLSLDDDERAKRERTIDEALEKMKERKGAKEGTLPESKEPKIERPRLKGPKGDPVRIDFDEIHERVRRITIPNVSEANLIWKDDSKRLAFASTVNGQAGIWAVDFPDPAEPKLVVNKVGGIARWIEENDTLFMLSEGILGSVSRGVWKPYPFSTRVEIDLAGKRRAGFVQAWRTMRDHWYDDRLGGRDWEAIRIKYEDAAANATDMGAFEDVVNLMLGELNGSHLGFTANNPNWAPPAGWREATPYLGITWKEIAGSRGLMIVSIRRDSPADRVSLRLRPGTVVLKIDRTEIGPETDMTALLNGAPDRDIRLTVVESGPLDLPRRIQNVSRQRDVLVRTASWDTVFNLLYKDWVRDNRMRVEKGSGGTLGYVHVRGMDWPSFESFEKDLYAAGAGKDGLVIDVRENGGGFTADHLLTILCQPSHATTIPRGGTAGYPQDRRVYATWDKPIIVLCNQNSFSNAEVFAHAIKTLKRGKLVGVRTAGGVISTGARGIMDMGSLRLPFRGWFLRDDGEDMEQNGAIPDITVWPDPSDPARGIDRQMDAAVAALLEDVKAWKALPRPLPHKAIDRK